MWWLHLDTHNKSTFDLLTLKVVPESRVTWATSVPIFVFPCLSVLDFRSDKRDRRQTDRRQTAPLLNAPSIQGWSKYVSKQVKILY